MHEFAAFCDTQLHNADSQEEHDRSVETRTRRKKEVQSIKAAWDALDNRKDKEQKDNLGKALKKASRWLRIDNEEHSRRTAARRALIQQCIENYMRSLAAWDKHDADILRLFAVWLEYAQDDVANQLVSEHSMSIPSAKFAVLMNQLTSLLQNENTSFQANLALIIRTICIEHPYHALHHIFAALNSKKDDATGISRQTATDNIAKSLKKDKNTRALLDRFWQADTMYHELAVYNGGKQLTAGREVAINNLPVAARLNTKIKSLKVPPATMSIPLRRDRDYSGIPHVVRYGTKISIASGLSAPKIMTAIGSDGLRYKQLVCQSQFGPRSLN